MELRQTVSGAENRSKQVLVNFLKTKRPEVFEKYLIKSVRQEGNTYKVEIVSSKGTYLGIIEDQGDLNLLDFQTISETLTCFDLDL